MVNTRWIDSSGCSARYWCLLSALWKNCGNTESYARLDTFSLPGLTEYILISSAGHNDLSRTTLISVLFTDKLSSFGNSITYHNMFWRRDCLMYSTYRNIQIRPQIIPQVFHKYNRSQHLTVLDASSCLQPSTVRAVTLKRAGMSLWGSIKPQPSVDTSHLGSFKIISVPTSIKQQMTVGAYHMWVLSNKLSHSKDENKTQTSEELWYYALANGNR